MEQAFHDGESLTPQQEYRRQLAQKTLDLLNGDISDYDAGMHSGEPSDGQ